MRWEVRDHSRGLQRAGCSQGHWQDGNRVQASLRDGSLQEREAHGHRQDGSRIQRRRDGGLREQGSLSLGRT